MWRMRRLLLLLSFAGALLLALEGQPCKATRMSSKQGYDLRGSYFGTFEKQQQQSQGGVTEDGEDGTFVLPARRDPASKPSKTERDSGTAVMCVCSSTALPHEDDKIEFAVDGVVAFLQNDRVGQKYPLDGVLRCPMPAGRGKVQGASHSLCHYVPKEGTEKEGLDYHDITLELDAAKSLQGQETPQGSSHVAFFNISGQGGSMYSGYIGSKLSALDSVCDDIACRKTPMANYKIVKETETETETETEQLEAPPTAPSASVLPSPPPRQEKPEEPAEQEEENAAGGNYPSGRDGSVAQNPFGKRRCGGESSQGPQADLTPDCGDQGFCMDELTGAACYWDCQPGWCSCTAGTCFDQDGKCTIQATYPASNNYQATCSGSEELTSDEKTTTATTSTTNKVKSVVDQDETLGKAKEPKESRTSGSILFDSGRDGARPMNYLKSLRCGGEKGKPSCGNMGFCLDEKTGERCFWDCDPGWCSCNSGACFDATGRCTESATYPESNNWQASCDIKILTESSMGVSRGEEKEGDVSATTYIAGKDGARPPNHLGTTRCGGKKGEPDCGVQGYCMDEKTGESCYWDCQPGWCSCTSGTCFDQDGKCTLPATYPQANNWQATCATTATTDRLRNDHQNQNNLN